MLDVKSASVISHESADSHRLSEVVSCWMLRAREIKLQRTLNPSLAGSLIRLEGLLKRPIEKELLLPVENSVLVKKDVLAKPWQKVEILIPNKRKSSRI